MIKAHTPPFDTVEDIGFPNDEPLSMRYPSDFAGKHDEYPQQLTAVFETELDINYKFREDELIRELKAYIDKTYDQHYAGGKIQATEDIIDDGHGTGFCVGNAKKYLKRYGKKGETPAEWRKDIMKVLHYSIIQLYIHDLTYGKE